MVEYLNQWKVESSDGKRFYTVSVTLDGQWSCSCVGWTRHVPRQDCKHIKGKKSANEFAKVDFSKANFTKVKVARVDLMNRKVNVPLPSENVAAIRADAERVKREAVQAKKDAALKQNARYGFQLAEAYEPADVLRGKWVAEIKFDGILGMNGDGKLVNRSGRDVTHRFPEISKVNDAVLVGEICVFGPDGLTVFNHIQERNTDDETKIRFAAREHPAVFMAFDILEYRGHVLDTNPFELRRKVLEGYIKTHADLKGVRIAEQIPIESNADILVLVNKMRELGGEGIIVKDLSAPWIARRGRGFLKCKTWVEEEFAIVGHEATGVGDGYVLMVQSGEHLQRVNLGDRRMREQVIAGHKRVELKFLSKSADGALRFPSIRRLV